MKKRSITFRLPHRQPRTSRPPRFLAVKLADVGDVLLTLPALAALRRRYPDAVIDILTPASSAALARLSPVIDNVIVFDKFRFDSIRSLLRPSSFFRVLRLLRRLRRGHYTSIILFHHLNTRWGTAKHAFLTIFSGARRRFGLHNGRGWFLTDRVKDRGFGYMHEAEYWQQLARLAGATPCFERPVLAISEDDRTWARDFLATAKAGAPLVAVHPGSGAFSLARRWPAERFAAVADSLVEKYGATIVLLGGKDEPELSDAVYSLMSHKPVVATGQTNLSRLYALLQSCDLLIGNDSGVMHIASAAGTPAIAIFGPSNDRAWRPFDWDRAAAGEPGGAGSKKYVVLRGFTGCSPCLYVGHRLGNRTGCETRECLMMVTPEDVVDAAGIMLGKV
jgi:lipopolysaccharide heptosyltransferase II